MFDICIIGAGAAGMMAAISAADKNPGAHIVIIEKNSEPGKKLGSTGNGKCNLSNSACPGHAFVLHRFLDLGLFTITDSSGRIYPYSEDAKDVVRILLCAIEKRGIHVCCHTTVTRIRKTGDFFDVQLSQRHCLDRKNNAESPNTKSTAYQGSVKSGKNRHQTYSAEYTDATFLTAKTVLIAAGGKAAPQFGTAGEGTKLAKSLGHSVSRLAPALTAIKTKENLASIAGVRAKCRISLYRTHSDNAGSCEEIATETGEVQFTRYGVSGICVFNLSRHMKIPQGKTLKNGFDDYEVRIDFLPGIYDVPKLLSELKQIPPSASTALPVLTSLPTLTSLVKKPLADYIHLHSNGDLTKLVSMLKEFRLHPQGLMGWDFAQVTAGGVLYDEIDKQTMQSRLVKGLFFAGEVLDYDGPCGGYNLQHAWESGIRAGEHLLSD